MRRMIPEHIRKQIIDRYAAGEKVEVIVHELGLKNGAHVRQMAARAGIPPRPMGRPGKRLIGELASLPVCPGASPRQR